MGRVKDTLTYLLDDWVRLSFILPGEELMERCRVFWELISTISGLTTGFTYLVTNQPPSFTVDIIEGTSLSRKEIYGALLVFSFLLCLSSTLLAATFVGMINLAGKEFTIQFVRTFGYLANVPLMLLVLGIVMMLLSGALSIGGNFGSVVWMITLIAGGVFIVLVFLAFMLMRIYVYNWIKEAQKKVLAKVEGNAPNDDHLDDSQPLVVQSSSFVSNTNTGNGIRQRGNSNNTSSNNSTNKPKSTKIYVG